ncbi:DUF305 domain-containing protein [Cumulibacter manganitolerans]|uniref:DUF305 domain-containing protein n=1 Tax=Cumulibacter manganitolerans TaxID=1884992 RepID=UPI000E88E96F|nr:DUF305 domain-containing protein [Cumulibacter manganitolerans]HBO54881.1 DUF305 domain-containing protein [Janibacter terrae]
MSMKKYAALAILLISALVTTACSSENEPAANANDKHNAADVTFATGMIPHHQQAIEMADMALEQAQDPQVKELADQIKGAQQPEIDQLTEWLTAWDEPVPSDSTGGHSGHDMSGMMSEEDMQMLKQASGTEFDTMWLEMMIEHHKGAVEMAQTEQSDGEYPEAIEMAKQIISSQQEEIDQMEQILAAS